MKLSLKIQNRTADLLLQPFIPPALPAPDISKPHYVAVGNQLPPGSFQEPPNCRKVFHGGGGGGEAQKFTLQPLQLTQQGRLSHPAAGAFG